MVGDTDAEVAAGPAGHRTLPIEHFSSAHKRLRGCQPDLPADIASGVEPLAQCQSEDF
jgi:hypothetical protein